MDQLTPITPVETALTAHQVLSGKKSQEKMSVRVRIRGIDTKRSIGSSSLCILVRGMALLPALSDTLTLMPQVISATAEKGKLVVLR